MENSDMTWTAALCLHTASTRLRREDWKSFKRACERRGTTPHAVLRLLIGAYNKSNGEPLSYKLFTDLKKESERPERMKKIPPYLSF